MKIKMLVLMLVGFIVAIDAQIAGADPHCRACPYSCGDLGLKHKDCSEIAGVKGLCCLDLTDKGLKLALEQERSLPRVGAQASVQDHCPSGFSPSERKCSNEERRRGCKDMRLPSGLGCVKR